MNKSFFKDFAKPAIVLTAICLVVSAALAGTYNLTKPVIAAQQQGAADAARAVVLEGAGSFTQLDASSYENVTEIYKEDSGLGYVITSTAKGYGGEMTVMTGIKADGTISGIKVISHSESQGIGSNVVANDEYLAKYSGADSTLQVDNYTGATVSSKALKSALTSAFKAFGGVAGVEVAEEKVDPKEVIFPEATFTEITLEGADKAYIADGRGYIVVTSDTGFDGKIEVYTGFDADWKIAGVALGDNGETPGIGGAVGETDYTGQYVGKDTLDDIQAVSGATYSSTGFKNCVTKALALIPALQQYDLDLNKEFFPDATEFTVLEGIEKADKVVRCGDQGYVITVSTDGYHGRFALRIGFDSDDKIVKIQVVESHESVGFGAQLTEQSYLDTWTGKGLGEAADAISGATVTSDAFRFLVTDKAVAVLNAAKEVA